MTAPIVIALLGLKMLAFVALCLASYRDDHPRADWWDGSGAVSDEEWAALIDHYPETPPR